jgi:hypothetical protein
MSNAGDPNGGPTEDATSSNIAPHSGFIEEMSELAQSKPDVFATIIQNFFNPPSEGTYNEIPLTEAIIAKSLNNDERREAHNYYLKLTFLLACIAGLAIALAFVLILVFLVRDKPEFLKAVLEICGLVITHVGIGATGYYVGKTKADAKDTRGD